MEESLFDHNIHVHVQHSKTGTLHLAHLRDQLQILTGEST